jgi:hypothetical protein
MATEVIGRLKTVSTTKALAAAGAYSAEQVLSQSATNNAGTAWTWDALANATGRGGYIVRAMASSETTNVTPRLTLFLFNVIPTYTTDELDDRAANLAPKNATIANYIGRIDFPELSDLGGNSEAVCSPSTFGGLPLSFMCAATDDALYGIVVTRDGFTQTATDDLTIKLTVEQY